MLNRVTTHERIHLRIKSFGKETQLHFENKPYFCTHCSRTFNQKCYLDKQERIHWKIILYSCSYCGKTSTQKCDVKRRKKFDLNIRAYCCTECISKMEKELDSTEE